VKFQQNDYLEIPHGNSNVWRYMNHWKLEKMLNESALFFPNAKKLSDQYEVTIPAGSQNKRRKELIATGLQDRALEEEMARFYWETNPMKSLTLINCWSINPHESYALWKIYLGGEVNGVAIKTSISSLKKAIVKGHDPFPEDIFVSKVKYKSYLNESNLSRWSLITTKKPFYDFEKELRLFIMNFPRSEGGYKTPYEMDQGRLVKVDLSQLIQKIYISPFSEKSYKQDVVQMLAKNGLSSVLIRDSEIQDQ